MTSKCFYYQGRSFIWKNCILAWGSFKGYDHRIEFSLCTLTILLFMFIYMNFSILDRNRLYIKIIENV